MARPEFKKIPPGRAKKDDPPPPPSSEPPPSSGNRIVLDPITRIEGHLRIEVEVTNGKVSNAWSSGTLFRGVETILKGRNPEDAWLFTQRLCGVCTYVHGAASVQCVENALGVTIPDNARIIRNLLNGAQYSHDHIVHFYHLHALDWVDIVSALSANPSLTASLANPSAGSTNFSAVQERLKALVESGSLGPFAGGYWGHPAYILTPEENLLLAAHYLEALRLQARTAQMHAVFGAKNPHVQSLRVGGVTCGDDINVGRIEEFRAYLKQTKDFIDTVYIPDVVLLAKKYKAWGEQNIGKTGNFLTFGDFPLKTNGLFFPRGVIFNQGDVAPMDPLSIQEHVRHSWYSYQRKNVDALHPAEGETTPAYNGLDTSDRYSWLKAPRYDNEPMEVGPLARVLMAYKNGSVEARKVVDDFLGEVGLDASGLYSTLGRTAARALETKMIADAMMDWFNDDNESLVLGGRIREASSMPMQAQGSGLTEAPRGALGHWIDIQNGQIENYQMVVPSTWNLGPRCANDKLGPVEEALIGTPVEDPAQPVEVLRTVHSFDPCIACAVHVIDPHSNQVYKVRAL